jgi:hypothetical protein
MRLGEQIRKERWQSNPRGARLFNETPIGGLEAETERRAVIASLDVRSVERKDHGLIPKMRERADECSTEADFESLDRTAISRARGG